MASGQPKQKSPGKATNIDQEIQRMVNYIEQDGSEKVEEIDIKAEEEFMIEKNKYRDKEIVALAHHYDRLEEKITRETQADLCRVTHSSRLHYLQAQNDIMNDIRLKARKKLDKFKSKETKEKETKAREDKKDEKEKTDSKEKKDQEKKDNKRKNDSKEKIDSEHEIIEVVVDQKIGSEIIHVVEDFEVDNEGNVISVTYNPVDKADEPDDANKAGGINNSDKHDVDKENKEKEEEEEEEEEEGAYKKLVTALMVQGVIKMLDDKVQIRVREDDKSLVEECFASVKETYKELVGKEVELSIHSQFLPSQCMGGIILVSESENITVDNTIEARIYVLADKPDSALLPEYRLMLFGSNPNRKHFD